MPKRLLPMRSKSGTKSPMSKPPIYQGQDNAIIMRLVLGITKIRV
jgi:hypothetical protein